MTTFPKNGSPFVSLERDPVVEKYLSDLEPSPAKCIVCGNVDIAPESESSPDYEEVAVTFKDLLMTAPFREKVSPQSYTYFIKNIQTCVTCLTIVEEAGAMHYEIVWLQKSLDDLITKARESMITADKSVTSKSKSTNTQVPNIAETSVPNLVKTRSEIVKTDINEEKKGVITVINHYSESNLNSDITSTTALAKSEKLIKEELPQDDNCEIQLPPIIFTGNSSKNLAKKRTDLKSEAMIDIKDEEFNYSAGDYFDSDCTSEFRETDGDTEITEDMVTEDDANVEPQIQTSLTPPTTKANSKSVTKPKRKYTKKSSKKLNSKARLSLRKPLEFRCSNCKNLFTRKFNLVKHEIEICKIAYSKNELQKMDITLHPCISPECTRVFLLKVELDRHVLRHRRTNEGVVSTLLGNLAAKILAQKTMENKDDDIEILCHVKGNAAPNAGMNIN